jgi:hypothetical protein
MSSEISPLLGVVKEYLEEAEYGQYVQFIDSGVAIVLSEARCTYRVCIVVDDETQHVVCFTNFSSNVPAFRRAAVAEAVARANYGLTIGHFDIDMHAGSLRFKTAVDVEGGELVTPMVHNIVGASLWSCERYHDALMSVAFGDVDPAAAIAAAEIERANEVRGSEECG